MNPRYRADLLETEDSAPRLLLHAKPFDLFSMKRRLLISRCRVFEVNCSYGYSHDASCIFSLQAFFVFAKVRCVLCAAVLLHLRLSLGLNAELFAAVIFLYSCFLEVGAQVPRN